MGLTGAVWACHGRVLASDHSQTHAWTHRHTHERWEPCGSDLDQLLCYAFCALCALSIIAFRIQISHRFTLPKWLVVVGLLRYCTALQWRILIVLLQLSICNKCILVSACQLIPCAATVRPLSNVLFYRTSASPSPYTSAALSLCLTIPAAFLFSVFPFI